MHFFYYYCSLPVLKALNYYHDNINMITCCLFHQYLTTFWHILFTDLIVIVITNSTFINYLFDVLLQWERIWFKIWHNNQSYVEFLEFRIIIFQNNQIHYFICFTFNHMASQIGSNFIAFLFHTNSYSHFLISAKSAFQNKF